MSNCSTQYLEDAIDSEKSQRMIKELVKYIRDSRVKFDAIVFRGMSGALVAPIVAYKMKKPLIMCRKGSDDSHSGIKVEGFSQPKTYIIIDDFICTGATLAAIVKTLRDAGSEPGNTTTWGRAKCVGAFLYRSINSTSRTPVP